jgi:hypothetical protein
MSLLLRELGLLILFATYPNENFKYKSIFYHNWVPCSVFEALLTRINNQTHNLDNRFSEGDIKKKNYVIKSDSFVGRSAPVICLITAGVDFQFRRKPGLTSCSTVRESGRNTTENPQALVLLMYDRSIGVYHRECLFFFFF